MEFQFPTEYGWICPKCGRANAPWKSSCDCTENHNVITCDDTVDTTWSNSILNDKNAKFTIYIPIDEKGEYK